MRALGRESVGTGFKSCSALKSEYLNFVWYFDKLYQILQNSMKWEQTMISISQSCSEDKWSKALTFSRNVCYHYLIK